MRDEIIFRQDSKCNTCSPDQTIFCLFYDKVGRKAFTL